MRTGLHVNALAKHSHLKLKDGAKIGIGAINPGKGSSDIQYFRSSLGPNCLDPD
jgi:hypothetical protein